jgi:hypothetical protein
MQDLFVYADESGRKIKTEGLSLKQNSDGNNLWLYTKGEFTVTDVFFRRPDGRVSPKYHMVYQGYDTDLGYYKWLFPIPYEVTSFTMATASAKLDVSFASYYRDSQGKQLSPTISNSVISVSRVDNSDVLDASYNGVDVQNLWSSIGDAGYKIADLYTNKADKVITINGNSLATSFVLSAGDIPYESDGDSNTTKMKIDSIQTQANTNTSDIVNIKNGISTVGKATLADKATADANGNPIITTYQTIAKHDQDKATLAAADVALQSNIDSEKSARQQADTTLQNNLTSETNLRVSGDSNLQSQIDSVNATQNVIDIVGTKAELDAYDKTKLHTNDKIEVLVDETQNSADVIYDWNGSAWTIVGAKAAYYSKAEADTKFETVTDHNNDRGHLYQLDFTGTLSGDTLTFVLTNSADEINLIENITYELDMHFAAVGTLSNTTKMVIHYGTAPLIINLSNILNNTGTMLVGDMKQLEKYSNDTGFRWIFNAVYNSVNGLHFFGIPATVVREDILAMTDDELATHIADTDLEKGQLVFIYSVGTGNGFYLGHTYKVNGATITDVTAVYPHVKTDATTSAVALTPVSGEEYRYGTISSLTLTLPTDIYNHHSTIAFTSGATATTVSFPTGTRVIGMHVNSSGVFLPRSNTEYLLSLRNDGNGNLCVMAAAL